AALADRSGDALHGAESDVPARENAGDARLEQVRVALELPPADVAHIRSGEHVAALVNGDLRRQPGCLSVGPDHDEQAAGFEPLRLAVAVRDFDRLERRLPAGGDDL